MAADTNLQAIVDRLRQKGAQAIVAAHTEDVDGAAADRHIAVSVAYYDAADIVRTAIF